eukprot:TRINITY_DN15476_c0_g1_i1.p1 TRINITY_DN15476_c0_g1~~TRINITY_DN15476_c0_g1_i1.p1  ORF type:complete len:344 (+),score=81.13 TRINITY_DN15476_c0_g1_i1:92-1033(+)
MAAAGEPDGPLMPVYARVAGSGEVLAAEVPPAATVGDLLAAVSAAAGRRVRALRFQGRLLPVGAALADEGVCPESQVEEDAGCARWHGEACVNMELSNDRETASCSGTRDCVLFTERPLAPSAAAAFDEYSEHTGFTVRILQWTPRKHKRARFGVAALPRPGEGALNDTNCAVSVLLMPRYDGELVRFVCCPRNCPGKEAADSDWVAADSYDDQGRRQRGVDIARFDDSHRGLPLWGFVAIGGAGIASLALAWASPDPPVPGELPRPLDHDEVMQEVLLPDSSLHMSPEELEQIREEQRQLKKRDKRCRCCLM